MRQKINKIISFIKKEKFELDERIPLSFLIHFFYEKVICLIYGFLIFRKQVFIHPSCTIKCKNKIKNGSNLVIDRNSYIDALSINGVVFGNNVSIGRSTSIQCTGSLKCLGKGLIVGDNVGLGTHGHYGCAGGLNIGSDTIIGNYVSFHSENHNYSNINIPIRLQGVNHKGIRIGQNCWIGAKATILDGTVLGNGCIVAAGAIVKGEFPDNCIIGGVPGKIIKYRS